LLVLVHWKGPRGGKEDDGGPWGRLCVGPVVELRGPEAQNFDREKLKKHWSDRKEKNAGN